MKKVMIATLLLSINHAGYSNAEEPKNLTITTEQKVCLVSSFGFVAGFLRGGFLGWSVAAGSAVALAQSEKFAKTVDMCLNNPQQLRAKIKATLVKLSDVFAEDSNNNKQQ